MKIKLSILFFFLCLLPLSIGITAVQAQSAIELIVSPPVSYLHVPPGTQKNHVITLENPSAQAITVTPKVVDFTTDGKSGQVIVLDSLSFPYISSGKSGQIGELTIPANSKAQLTLHIDIPNDAAEKEYPMTVLFISKEQNSYSNKTLYSQVKAGIGSNLIVLTSYSNKLGTALSIVDLQKTTLVDSFSKIRFAPIVKNDTLATVTASGSAQIINFNEKIVAEFTVHPDNILGKNTRELRAGNFQLTDDLQKKSGFEYKPKFLFGPYKIILTLTQNNEQILTTTEVVYAFPFSLLILCILGTMIYMIYRHFNKNIDNS